MGSGEEVRGEGAEKEKEGEAMGVREAEAMVVGEMAGEDVGVRERAGKAVEGRGVWERVEEEGKGKAVGAMEGGDVGARAVGVVAVREGEVREEEG